MKSLLHLARELLDDLPSSHVIAGAREEKNARVCACQV